jgi:mRNA interferase MazF
LFLGIPTTTKVKESNDYFYPFEYKDKNTNLLKVSAMILQVKVFSTKRVMNKIGVMNKEDFKKTQEKLKSLVGPT